MKKMHPNALFYICSDDIQWCKDELKLDGNIIFEPNNEVSQKLYLMSLCKHGKIGGNLNQIARALNEYGTPYNALSVEVRAAISDLAALKFEVLRKVGDAVGNIQTYQL